MLIAPRPSFCVTTRALQIRINGTGGGVILVTGVIDPAGVIDSAGVIDPAGVILVGRVIGPAA